MFPTTSAASVLRRSSIHYRRSLVAAASTHSSLAGRVVGAEKGRGGVGGDELPFSARSVAAWALALGGSGLGIWLLPSSSSSSPVSFADASDVAQCDDEPQGIEPRESKGEKKPKYLFGDSYRRRVFFNYEKRLRMRSPPEKIFEYFASYKSPEGEVFMSPADLMKAIVPVFPPSESDNVREGHLRGEHSPGELHCSPSTFFMLFDTNNDGLISFAEYIFFVTLLSIPESSFTVAFKMFDLDNNGQIEKDEFKKVMTLMRSSNRQGATHSDGLRYGLKVSCSVEDGGLVEYFFGKDGKGYLLHDTFVQFLKDLHDEIIRLEFAHYDFKSRGSISAKDFALSMVASADMNHINKCLDRVDELDNDPSLRDIRVTFEEFKAFAALRQSLQPLATAMFSYGKVNGMLTKQDFIRAASYVCNVSLTDNMVDVIFYVFDTNRDGSLSSEEFLRALQSRETNNRHSTGSGFLGLFSCWSNCLKCCSSSQASF